MVVLPRLKNPVYPELTTLYTDDSEYFYNPVFHQKHLVREVLRLSLYFLKIDTDSSRQQVLVVGIYGVELLALYPLIWNSFFSFS